MSSLLQNGLAGRVRAKIAGLKMQLAAADQEQRDLGLGRRLDAEEVGRRADRRQAECEASERRPPEGLEGR